MRKDSSPDEFFNNLISEVKRLEDNIFKKQLPDIVKFLSDILEKFRIKSLNDLKVLIRYAWNLEILENVDEYSLGNAIEWFKDNHPGQNYTACLLMVKDKFNDNMTLHHVFINNKYREPVLDGSLPYRIVETRRIDEELKKVFGNKDMILLK